MPTNSMNFEKYFEGKNLKKTPKIGIHFEQKTTPDLIWCVSHVILDVTKDNRSKEFTDKDIRSSVVFDSLMQNYFSKPPQKEAVNEYNKVSSYQLGLLAFAGVLKQTRDNPKIYKIAEENILDYLAINDFNSTEFLCAYVEKFLKDNNLIEYFENYKNRPSQQNYVMAKDAYWKWAKQNTNIKGTNTDHSYRVFNKIFNLYCYSKRIPGEDSSKVTRGTCPYSSLIYNRKNFRDENKPSSITRNQYKKEIIDSINSDGVVETLLAKAKEMIRSKYKNESEIKEAELGYAPNSGVHIHHILPRQFYPQFSLEKENLIALTPGQHLSSAHVQADPTRINPEYQKVCLIKKLIHIKESAAANEDFYDLKIFIKMINELYKCNLDESASIDKVESILTKI